MTGLPRRTLLATPALLLATRAGWAQGFPNQPVRLVIPYPAGGSLDVVGRAVAQRFQEITGQPLVLDNRGGASGTIAADHVAKSRPDGHTLILASAPQLSIASFLQRNLAYDPRADLVPVTWMVSTPFAMFAAKNFPARDVAGVIAAGKERPGQIPFGSPGNGSLGHLAMEMFAQASDTKWLHVPYRGAALVLNDMAAGTVALTFTVIASAKPMLDSGLLQAIAIAAPQRAPTVPAMPSFAEAGFPQVDVGLWLGVMAPRGTPPEAVARLDAVLRETLADAGVRRTLETSGATVVGEGPAAFARLLEEDYPRWGGVIRRGNIALD
jgi:tripartite-type tricarboxylate transporter receptor subunit TctC